MFNFTAFVLYVMIWMVALFAILPLGVAPDQAPDSATGWRGAPVAARMWRKLAITTVVSAVIWLGVEAIIVNDWLSFRHGILAGPKD